MRISMAIQPNPLFIPPHPLRQPRNLDVAGQRAHVKALWPQVYTGDPDAQIQRNNPQAALSSQGLATAADDDQY